MNNNLSKRRVIDITVKDLLNMVKTDSFNRLPTKIRIIFNDKNTVFDLGCLAYSFREKQKTRNGLFSHSECLIDIRSLQSDRVNALKYYIENFATALLTGRIKETTCKSKIRDFISFVDWCDAHGYSYVFLNINQARIVYESFSRYLESKISSGQLNTKTATVYQKNTIEGISWSLNVSQKLLQSGVYKIRQNEMAVNKTAPPSKSNVDYITSLCSSIFDGIFDLLSKNKNFPYLLSLPNESCWVFPGRPYWTATQEKLGNSEKCRANRSCWDYQNGKIFEIEEIQENYSYTSDSKNYRYAKHAVTNAENALTAANAE